MLLGSVSAEIVDHAPAPVHVVRDAPIDSVLFADDGSTSVGPARAILRGWAVLRHLPVTVLTVAETEIPTAGLAAGLYDEAIESYSQSIDVAVAQCSDNAERTADELGRAGYAATAVVRDGDAAHAIVELAQERGIGLIVMGTRGHTGLTRLVLGSVARNVLLHAPCSVLIVPEHVKPVRTEQPVATAGAPA
jgi:nucleotide-binding universal stress UspA family protein